MPVPAPSVLPAVVDPAPFSEAELFALAGFLAGYSGLTYEAYALDLRQYASYCVSRGLSLFEVRRAHLEGFGRELESSGKARATIARRLARSRASTATPSKKVSSRPHRPCTCAARDSTTNHTRPVSTATNSAR